MELWQSIGALSITVFAFATASHALLNKRDPRSALVWCGLCFLLPVLGAVLYLLFGINRVQARARKLQLHEPRGDTSDFGPLPLLEDVPEPLRGIARLSTTLQPWPPSAGNRVLELHNGDVAFPDMLAAIGDARQRVCLSSYIFAGRGVGGKFVDALAAAHDRGVDVRVLVDGIGEFYTWPRARKILVKRGVRALAFNPPTLIPPALHINLRDHRKILTIDGRVAYTGGMNLDDRHLMGDGTHPGRVVDIHFRLEGPVAHTLEAAFFEDWQRITKEPRPELAPPQVTDGDAVCQVLTDGPGIDLDKLKMILTGAVSRARRSVHIMTPYFLPPRELTGAMQAAALAGTEVHVILPAKNNLPMVHWATRNALWELIRNGVRVWYQPPPFVHTKLFIVDGQYMVIGSANLDPRSLRLNFELGLAVHDRATIARLESHFIEARDRAAEMTLDTLKARSLGSRVRDASAWLFSPYL